MKTIFIALKEIKENEEFLRKLKEKYVVESTIYLNSLDSWLKEKPCDLVLIETSIDSNGFFFDPKLLDRCGTEFYRQRIQPKGIPTIFLVGYKECRKSIEAIFPNSNFGEKNISLLQSIETLIGI